MPKRNQSENEYEKQRAKRMEENRARMEALGLPKMANSLMNSVSSSVKGKNKKKKKKIDEDEDEEYTPVVDETEGSEEEEDKEWSASRYAKGKKKSSTTPKKKVQVQKLIRKSDYVDEEDEAFMRALALSIESKMSNKNEGCSGVSESSDPQPTNGKSSEKKGNGRIQKESATRKQKKQLPNRMQMTEDELVVHFFQFDEAGKGGISVKDLELMAATHDFTWTDKELADMIYCFDTDGDGKLSLDDFRKIVERCNLVERS